jgi:alanine-synthesizing transaminase
MSTIQQTAGLLAHWGSASPSSLARILQERQASKLPTIDLISASPQEHGIEYSPDKLAEIMALAVHSARRYVPDSKGLFCARDAIARWHGNGITPSDIIITSGTSIAYFYIFRLLAASGAEILCPSPTYPLFDDLAAVAGISVRKYHLTQEQNGRWAIDLDEIRFQITPRTKALVVVSPHNPTGSVASMTELNGIAQIAEEYKLVVIFDEVFRSLTHNPQTAVARPSESGAPLTVTLNGLSKMLSLPGLKAGWIAVEGKQALREQFTNALDYMSDCFLPVSDLMQHALPQLLETCGDVSERLAKITRARMRHFADEWSRIGVPVVIPEGTPYLCIPIDRFTERDDDDVAGCLLREFGILTHPGSYYDMPPNFVVTTCIHAPPWPMTDISSFFLKLKRDSK